MKNHLALAKSFIQHITGDGRSTSVWYDYRAYPRWQGSIMLNWNPKVIKQISITLLVTVSQVKQW